MSIIKETWNIEFRKTVTCPAGKTVMEMTKNLKPDEKLPAKLIIGKKKEKGRWPIFIDDEDSKNLVGIVTSLTNNGKDVDDLDIEMIAGDGNYEIVLVGPQTSNFVGQFNLLKDEASANKKNNADTGAEIDALVKDIVDRGLETAEEMAEKIKVLRENEVDNFLIVRVLRKYRKYKKPCHHPSTVYVDPYLESNRKKKQEGIIAEGLRAAVLRQAIICEGEKSVGKNVYLETIAWLMGQPQYLITFSRQMSPASIYGEKSTDNSAAKTLADFDAAILARANRVEEMIRFSMNLLYKQGISADKAMETAMAGLKPEDRRVLEQAAEFRKLQAQSASVNIIIDASELYDWLEDGGQMVFNEMNMAEANFFASFTNQLLDGTGFLFIPGRGEVPIHPDCVLFGTQNAEYQGVEQQNEATMSRFGCIDFPQPKSIRRQLVAATEARLVKDGFAGVKLDTKYYAECEAFYQQCRKAVHADQVSNAVLNIRGFVRALTAVAESDGYARLKRQIALHVVNTTPVDERQGIMAILDNIVTL